MFTTLKNAFKIKEIRMKLLFTFLMLVVIRFGSQLPVPGVDRNYFAQWFAAQTSGAFNFFDAFTGGSFLNMSVFALNITPYITSSIIMQLLTIAIPKLEEMQKDGEDGRKKIASITRYVTVALALIESSAMAIGFGNQGLLEEYNALNVITVIAALTAVVPLMREMIYWYYRSRISIAEYMEVQAGFLEMHALAVQNSKARSSSEKRAILAKQERVILKLRRTADKLTIKSAETDDLVKKVIQKDNALFSLNQMEKTIDDNKMNGMGIQIV